MFLAKFFRAFVGCIADGNNLDLWMVLERRQVTRANNVARSDDPNPQLIIIFMH